MYRLVVTRHDGSTTSLDLGTKPLTIGRARDCDVQSEEPRISRHHCFISLAGGRPSVLDGGSTNGTFVNGENVHQAWLQHGDVVTVGSLRIAVEMAWSPTTADQEHAVGERATSIGMPVRGPAPPFDEPPPSPVPRSMTPPPPPPPRGDQTLSSAPFRQIWPDEQLGLIYQLGALLARSVDMADAAEAVADLVLDVVPVERVFVLLQNQEARSFEVLATKVRGGAEVPDSEPSQTILEKTHESGAAIYCLDVQGDPSLSRARSLMAMKTRVALCSPLRHGDEVIGLLYSDAPPGPQAPTEDTLALYGCFADQAALALGRARLHSEIVAKHEVLRRQRDQLDAFSRDLEQRVEEKTALVHEQRAELARRLTELERLQAAKEVMARALVHDIKNLVGSIVPNLSFLGTLLPPDPEATQALEDTMEGADRIVSMAQDLLTISRMEDGSFQLSTASVEVADLLRQAVRRHTLRARELGVDLILGNVEPLLEVTADAEVMGRVLDNLIGNAIRYAGRGGRVVLSGGHPSKTVDLVVSDTGPGVSPEERERIFEEWYRSSGRSARHHGIGLYFCRLAVAAHGGSVRVEGGPGDNRFVVSIPGGWEDFDEDSTALHDLRALKKQLKIQQ